ncbi:S16 family serine protease [Candidatus Nitrospira salsa]|nr:MAG: hypothetical protein NPIRA01_09130 [Nitrospirales bacterium]
MTKPKISSTHICSDLSSNSCKREACARVSRYIVTALFVVLFVGSYADMLSAQETAPTTIAKRSVIPILGTTYNEEWEQVGIVADVEVEFERRDDHDGLQLDFLTKPGRFSSLAKRSVQEALALVTQAAGLNADSWTVRFRLPYAGVTLYGESLSAMAAMSVVALAKGEMVHGDIVMTGTVTPEGSIGTVGGIPLKIVAAHQEHFRRVLIPEEPDVADGDWETPFLMHVSPVRSVDVAYFALTDHHLKASGADQQFEVSLAR